MCVIVTYSPLLTLHSCKESRVEKHVCILFFVGLSPFLLFHVNASTH